MQMRTFLAGLTLLAMAVVAAGREQPNVILIFIDDLGYGDAGFNGAKGPKTPNLDQTAKQGIEPGEIDTGVAAYDAVSTAVQDFFGTLEGILGGENIADTDVSATAEDEGAEVVALGDPAEDATSTYESIVDSVGEALDGFWAALQEGGPARRANPFAGYYEAVGTVTDPNLEASTSTTVSLV